MTLFCPKCKTLLKRDGDKLVCPSCQYTEKLNKNNKDTKISFSEEKTQSLFRENMQKFPEVNEKCPKCGNPTAYVMVAQTRSADEAPTKIYKCTKCGHIWRDYT